MKTILKTSLVLSTIVLWTLWVSADETASGIIATSTGATSTGVLTQTGVTKDEWKQKMKQERESLHQDVKDNLQDFKTQSGSLRDNLNLSAEDKAKVEALRKEHALEMDALKADYEAKINLATTPEQKEALRAEMRVKMQELSKAYFEELRTLVPQDAQAHAYIDARKAVFEENQALRKASLEKRKELRWERKSYIIAQKEILTKSLGKKVDTIVEKDQEKVANILTKIDAMIAKFEVNTKLSEANKQKILDQLKALKELIEDSVTEQEIEAEVD